MSTLVASPGSSPRSSTILSIPSTISLPRSSTPSPRSSTRLSTQRSASVKPAVKKTKRKKKLSKSVKLTEEFVILFMRNLYAKKLLPPNLQLISDFAQSGSGANVYLYKQGTHNYIIKVLNNYDFGKTTLNQVITEVKIYNYLNALRIFKICDHIILHYDAARYIHTDNTSTFLMVNETSTKDEKVQPLHLFIKNIINSTSRNKDTYMLMVLPTLLFQLMYTLECFVRAKVKHNDLHLGNVLVFISSNNIIANPLKFTNPKYDKYVVTSRTDKDYFGPDNDIDKALYKSDREDKNIYQETVTYYVPDYGFKIKIFDFDRSCVYDINNKPVMLDEDEYQNIPDEYINYTKYKYHKYEFKNYKDYKGDNNIPYEYIDLYKLFGDILYISPNTEPIYKIYYNYLINALFDTDRSNIRNLLYESDSAYTKIENYPNFFKKPTVYETLTHIFNNSNPDCSIFNFTTVKPKKLYIKNTFKLSKITAIWGNIGTDVLNTQQPLETGIPIYKSVRRTLKGTLNRRRKSKHHPVSKIVNSQTPVILDNDRLLNSEEFRLSENTSDSEDNNSSDNSSNVNAPSSCIIS